MGLIECSKTILDQVMKYEGSVGRILIFIAVYIWLMVEWRAFRQKMGYPLLVIWLLILNPVLYTVIWDKIMGVTYWRLFWLLLEVVVYALFGVKIMEKVFKSREKKEKTILIAFGLFCIVIACSGGSVYGLKKKLKSVDNLYRIPQVAVDVTNTLLEMEKNPKVLFPKSLYCYVRQYTNKIELPYGRNAEGYTTGLMDEELLNLKATFDSKKPDYAYVARICHKNDVDYIVAVKRKNIKLDDYGYRFVKQIEKYSIYENVWGEGESPGWEVEKIPQIKGDSDVYRIKDAYGRQAIIGGGGISDIDRIHSLITQYSNVVTQWIVPEFGENAETFYRTVIEGKYDIEVESALLGNIDEESVESIVNAQGNEYFQFIYKCLEGVVQYVDVSFLEKGQEEDVLGLKMRILESYNNDSDSNMRDMCSMSFSLESRSEILLYVPYLTEKRVALLKKEFAEKEVELLIIADDNDEALKKKLLQQLNVKNVWDGEDKYIMKD